MTPMRQAALEALAGVQGAFLRCDRGKRLYVTNAPARSKETIDWAAYGFQATRSGGLEFLMPGQEWMKRYEEWIRERVRTPFLADAIAGTTDGAAEKEDMELWTEGVKRLEMRSDAAAYEKMVRQRTAVVLRKKRGGGTLMICALTADLMREGGYTDED